MLYKILLAIFSILKIVILTPNRIVPMMHKIRLFILNTSCICCSLKAGDNNVHIVPDFCNALSLKQLRRMTSLIKPPPFSLHSSGSLTSVRRRGMVLIRLEDDKYTKLARNFSCEAVSKTYFLITILNNNCYLKHR